MCVVVTHFVLLCCVCVCVVLRRKIGAGQNAGQSAGSSGAAGAGGHSGDEKKDSALSAVSISLNVSAATPSAAGGDAKIDIKQQDKDALLVAGSSNSSTLNDDPNAGFFEHADSFLLEELEQANIGGTLTLHSLTLRSAFFWLSLSQG